MTELPNKFGEGQLEEYKKNVADYVFGEISEIAKANRFSCEDFNDLLDWAEDQDIVEKILGENRLAGLEKKQSQDKLLRVVRSIDKPSVYTLVSRGPLARQNLKSQVFEYLPKLRAKALEFKEKKGRVLAYQQKRQERQKEIITDFDELLQGPRKLVVGLEKQMSENFAATHGKNAAVNLLWTLVQGISKTLKGDYLAVAKNNFDNLKRAGISKFGSEDYLTILAKAKEQNLVKNVWTRAFDRQRREQAKKDGRKLVEKPKAFEFLYRHWTTDKGKATLMIDLYQFTGNKNSEVAKGIFDELRLYGRLVEPLQRIELLREKYRLLRSRDEFHQNRKIGLAEPEERKKDWKEQLVEAQAGLTERAKIKKGEAKTKKRKKQQTKKDPASKAFKRKREQEKRKTSSQE